MYCDLWYKSAETIQGPKAETIRGNTVVIALKMSPTLFTQQSRSSQWVGVASGKMWEGIPLIFIFPCLCCCTKRMVSWLVSSRMSTQTTTAPHRPSSNAISRPMPLTWTS
jgi:hypothetical protein